MANKHFVNMPNIISHRGNANQNHYEIQPHTTGMAIIKKDTQ